MSKKIVVPAEILQYAKRLNIQWSIECQLLPAEKINNTLLVETFSNGKEKRHIIRTATESVLARLEQNIVPWTYAMGRFALSEKFGVVFGDSTYEGIDRRIAAMLIWISDVWVFDLMKSKTEEITQNVCVAIARILLKKYKKIKGIFYGTLAAFDLLRWMAMTDRVLGQFDYFALKGFEVISQVDQSEQPCQSEAISRIAQFACFCGFIRDLDHLLPCPILASSQFDDASRDLSAAMNCPYVPSLDIKSGEWKFKSI